MRAISTARKSRIWRKSLSASATKASRYSSSALEEVRRMRRTLRTILGNCAELMLDAQLIMFPNSQRGPMTPGLVRRLDQHTEISLSFRSGVELIPSVRLSLGYYDARWAWSRYSASSDQTEAKHSSMESMSFAFRLLKAGLRRIRRLFSP